MVYAVRQIPRWTIDGKRVLAFAGVLLLHLLLLGMVLLPREPISLTTAKPDDVYVPMEIVNPPEPPPLPPPPIAMPPPPVNLQVAAPPPTVLPQPQSAPVTTTTEIVLNTPSELPVLPQGEFDSGASTDPGLGQGLLLTLKVKRGPPPAYPRRELAKGLLTAWGPRLDQIQRALGPPDSPIVFHERFLRMKNVIEVFRAVQ